MDNYDYEQMAQEDIIWPWLADDSMADPWIESVQDYREDEQWWDDQEYAEEMDSEGEYDGE